jgi:L-threonylcarbamoyladenylate synthase
MGHNRPVHPLPHITPVSALRPEPAAIAAAVDILRSGGVVAFPTDTLYGLAVDPRREDAVARLFALKGRDPSMAVPLVAGSLDEAMVAGTFGPQQLRLAEAFWPGPLSIVVPAATELTRSVLGGRTTIAIRVPDHPVPRALAGAFGFCVTATSANLSGSPAPASAEALDPAIRDGVDLVLDAGPAPGGRPSTLVAFDPDGPVLVRAGAIAWDRVIKSLE